MSQKRLLISFPLILLAALQPARSGAAEAPGYSSQNAQQTPTAKTTEPKVGQAPPTLEQILDKYVKALGGKAALQAPTSRVMKGTIEAPAIGAEGAIEIYAKAPNKQLTEVALSMAGNPRTGFNGATAWHEEYGEAKELTVYPKRDADFYLPLKLRELYPRIELKGKEKLGAREVYRLEAPRLGNPRRWYFDTESGLLLRVETRNSEGNLLSREDYEDYRAVDGIKYPFTTRELDQDQTETVIKYGEIKHNVPLDDAKFDMPAAKAASPQMLSREGGVRLPFEHYYGLIFLSVRVNGSEPMSFVFDTGASLTFINDRSVDRLGLKLRGQRRIAGRDGGEGAIDLAFVKGVAIDLGDVRFAPDQVGVTSLASAEKFLGHPMDGILGGDFIRRYVVEIDYAGKALTLYEPKTYHAGHGGANAETLALKMIGLLPCVSARLKLPGREALDVLFGIDTGAAAAGGLSLNSPFVTRHKLIESMPKVFPRFSAGLSGESRGVAGRAESLTLGRTAVLNPIVGFSQATKGAGSWTEPSGFIGSEIWRRFRVTLDYSRKQMRLEPNDSLLDPFESGMSGLIIAAEGADLKTLRIIKVRPDSPAAAADLREGDVLLALDDQPVSTITLFKAEQMLQQDGREILVGVRRGAEQLQVRFKLKRQI